MDYQHSIDEAYESANLKWKEAAEKRLYYLAKRRHFVTSDEILNYLDAKNIKTRNTSALGAIMQEAKRNGVLVPYGYQASTRKSRHQAPIRVWESTIVELWKVRHV